MQTPKLKFINSLKGQHKRFAEIVLYLLQRHLVTKWKVTAVEYIYLHIYIYS